MWLVETYIIKGVHLISYLSISTLAESLMHVRIVTSSIVLTINRYGEGIHRLLDLLCVAKRVPILTSPSEILLTWLGDLVLELIHLHVFGLRLPSIVLAVADNH